MKNLISFQRLALLFVLLFASIQSAHAYYIDFDVDGIYYRFVTGATVAVTSGTVDEEDQGLYCGDVYIPETVFCDEWGREFWVVEIDYRAFWLCDDLTSVTLPSSIARIDDMAFYGCSGLSEIIIPDGVGRIGEYAFTGCDGLTSVTIPHSVSRFGEFSFSSCHGLTEVNLLNETVGDYMFIGCKNLTTVNFSNSMTSIGDYAFYDTKLTSVVIPESLTTMGNGAFCDLAALQTICWNARNCSLDVEDEDYGYSGAPFEGCSNLRHIIFGEEVESLAGYRMFEIGDEYNHIDTVTCLAVTPPSIDEFCFTAMTYEHAVLCVPEGSMQDYQAANGWKEFAQCVAIPDGVTMAGDVDEDGVVGIADVTQLIDYILMGHATPFNAANADVDNDGVIGIGDVTAIIDIILMQR